MTGCQIRHSVPTIQRCYARFLEESNNPDDRESSEDAAPIREVLMPALLRVRHQF